MANNHSLQADSLLVVYKRPNQWYKVLKTVSLSISVQFRAIEANRNH